VLCNREQTPPDPCRSLNMVAHGAVGMKSASAREVQLKDGAVVGLLDVLPAPHAPIVDRIMREEEVASLQAVEKSVLIELSQAKLVAAVKQHPVLAEAYQANSAMWSDAVTPAALSRNWLLACFSADVLGRISCFWTPRVYSEDSVILTNADERSEYCFIVLEGSVQLTRKVAGVSEPLQQLAPIGVPINETTLVADAENTAHKFGEWLLSATALSNSFVLRLHRDTFAAACVQPPAMDQPSQDDLEPSQASTTPSRLSRLSKKPSFVGDRTPSCDRFSLLRREDSASCSQKNLMMNAAPVAPGSMHALVKSVTHAHALGRAASGRANSGKWAASSHSVMAAHQSKQHRLMNLFAHGKHPPARGRRTSCGTAAAFGQRLRKSHATEEHERAPRAALESDGDNSAAAPAVEEAVESLLELRRLCLERGKRLCPSWFREISAMPSALTDQHLEILCAKAETIVVPQGKQLFDVRPPRRSSISLEDLSSFTLATAAAAKSAPPSPPFPPSHGPHGSAFAGHASLPLPSALRPLRSRCAHPSSSSAAPPSPPQSPPSPSRSKVSPSDLSMEKTATEELIFVVLKGTLTTTGQHGASKMTRGDLFCSPLRSCWGTCRLFDALAATANEDCVLLRLDLEHVTDRVLAQEHSQEVAIERANATREHLRNELAVLRRELHQLQFRLGYRQKLRKEDIPRMFKKVLWLLRSAKLFLRGGTDFFFTFTEELSLADQLANDQEELQELRNETIAREKILQHCIAEWQALQPPIFPEERELEVSETEFPLENIASECLAEARRRVARLNTLREEKRLEGIDRLRKLWDALKVPDGTRKQILARTKEPNQTTFLVIAKEEKEQRRRLVEPMRAANARVHAAWDALGLPTRPEFVRHLDQHLCDKADVPTLEQLVLAELQAEKLEGCVAVLRPLLARLSASGGATEAIAKVVVFFEDFSANRKSEALEPRTEMVDVAPPPIELPPPKEEPPKPKDATTQADEGLRALVADLRQEVELLRARLAETEQKAAMDVEAMSALLHGEESVLKRQLAEALDAAQASREAQRAMEERTKQLLEQAESEKAALRDELLVASEQLEQLSSEKSDLARALAAFTGASSKDLGEEDALLQDEFMRQCQKNKELVRRISEMMSKMQMTQVAIDNFLHSRAAKVPALNVLPSPERIQELAKNAEELNENLAQLEERYASDGLLFSLRQVCSKNMWDSNELAKQITQGYSALKDPQNASEGYITKEQFTYWLNAKKIAYSEQSLDLFYDSVKWPKNSLKIRIQEFTKTFGPVKKLSVSGSVSDLAKHKLTIGGSVSDMGKQKLSGGGSVSDMSKRKVTADGSVRDTGNDKVDSAGGQADSVRGFQRSRTISKGLGSSNC